MLYLWINVLPVPNNEQTWLPPVCPLPTIGLTHTHIHANTDWTGPFSKCEHQQIVIEWDQLLIVHLSESTNHKTIKVREKKSRTDRQPQIYIEWICLWSEAVLLIPLCVYSIIWNSAHLLGSEESQCVVVGTLCKSRLTNRSISWCLCLPMNNTFVQKCQARFVMIAVRHGHSWTKQSSKDLYLVWIDAV